MLFRNCKLMLMFLLEEQTQDEVNRVFDYLTEVLGIELFQKLFEVISTDNGHEFQDRWNLKCDENGEIRTRIYYCDPNRSDQKGALEKNHEYIRYVLPKGTSFENITEETTLASNVKVIGANAFSGDKKLTTLVIRSNKLTKKGCRDSLNGSYIKTIKLSGSAKKLYKKYNNYFNKKNSGKSVKIKK